MTDAMAVAVMILYLQFKGGDTFVHICDGHANPFGRFIIVPHGCGGFFGAFFGCHDQRPLNAAARFCKKALTPSA